MFSKKPLIQAIAIALAAPLTVSAANDATCIGHFFEQSEEVPNVTPPTVKMITHQMLQLKAGESLVVSVDYTSDSGEASFFSCADQGHLAVETDDFSQIKLTAPPYIKTTQIIQWGIQISDNAGYVGGDSLLLRLIASGAGNPYIIIGTQDKILIYSPTGELKTDIAAIAQQLASIDSDNDGLEEIAVNDGSSITAYEFNGQSSEPNIILDSNIFLVKADVDGDGNQETITGSQTANEVSVDGLSFPVFVDVETATQTRSAATRKKNKGNSGGSKGKSNSGSQSKGSSPNKSSGSSSKGSSSSKANSSGSSSKGNGGKKEVTLCHKGKQTKTLPESAVSAHLGHGDTLGACDSKKENKDKGNGKDESKNEKKVTICHNGNTITLSKNALETHLGHGDKEGVCPDDDKATVCHDNTTITISPSALQEHLEHGDKQGICTSINDTIYGVNVAAGDLNGNGSANIVAAMAQNGSLIEIYTGDGQRLNQFNAFNSTNGVLVAVGDVTGNGHANIIAAEPLGSEIRIFDVNGTQTGSFPVNGTIVSLAVGMGTIEEMTTQSPADSTTIIDSAPDILSPDTTKEPAPDDSAMTTNDTSSQTTIAQEDSDLSLETTKIPEPDDSNSSLDTTEKPEEAEDLTESAVQPPTTYEPPAVLLPPSDGEIIGTYSYHGQTITDVTIHTDSSISDVELAGETINHGLVSNAHILPDSTLIGGTLTGYITNEGTIVDIDFVGAELTGGELAGTISVKSDTNKRGLGILANITLAKDTYIQGGILTDTVTGNAESPALIENAEIRADTELSYVIIGEGCQVAEDVNIGAGVRFVHNNLIPAGADLTAALSTDGVIDINTDILIDTDASSLLTQINEMPDIQLNDWQLAPADDNGQFEVTLEETRVTVIPLQVRQAKHNRGAQIIWHNDGNMTIVTAKGREIMIMIPDL